MIKEHKEKFIFVGMALFFVGLFWLRVAFSYEGHFYSIGLIILGVVIASIPKLLSLKQKKDSD